MSQYLSNLHLIRPVALLLLPLAIGLWLWWRRRVDPLSGWREQIEPELLSALVVGRESASNRSAQLVLLSWLLTIVAIAGPTWQLEPSPFADDATPLLILLKADISMDAADPAPSRLERAQLKIADLASARKGQPLGLIAYAGSSHLVLPPTRDTEVVAQMAAEISSDIMPMSGDRLDLALSRAQKLLRSGAQGGSIVVFVDSIDFQSESDALKKLAEDFEFPVLLLGINAQGSSQDESIRNAAKILKAKVEYLDVEDRDVSAIVRHAARAPKSTAGEQGERWQEAGYWLTPLIAIVILFSFRREEYGEAK